MTKEEYIDFANALKNNYTIDFDKLPEFCGMAISALSIEGDLISRQAVLNTLENVDKFLDEDRTVEKYKELLTECIKVLPSKGEWIPVSDPKKELPKDKMLWVTTIYSVVKCVYWDMTEWSQCIDDVIAYMLYIEPEPYKAENEDKQ